MALNADEQRELDQLEYEKLVAEKHDLTAKAAAEPNQAGPATAPVEDKREINNASDLLAAPGKIMDDMTVSADKLKAQGWENLSPSKRLELLALSFPKFLGREVMGAGQTAEGMAERAIPTAIGQFAGRATRLPGMDRVGGALGAAAGETLAELREGGDLKPGAIGGAALSGLVTGKPLAGAGAKEVLKEGAKYAGTNLASKVLETEVDEGRLPTAGEAGTVVGAGMLGAPAARIVSKVVSAASRPKLYDMEMEVLRDLRKEGVVIPPHEIGAGSDTLTSIAGKTNLQQESVKRNQFAWQKLARDEIGLSKEALPIRQKELDQVREAAGEPYRKITDIQQKAAEELAVQKQSIADKLADAAKESDPQLAAMKTQAVRQEEAGLKPVLDTLETLSAADVQKLKDARFTAQRARKAFFAGDPKAYETWQNAKAQASQLEDTIDQAAVIVGDDKLLNQLKQSRKTIAQTYAIEEAVNPGNGFVDPLAFGRQLANGEKISGNLEKIAKFQLAFRREAVEAGRVPTPGAGNVNAMGTTMMASRGDAPGVIGAVVNATAGRAARPILLSDMVQEGMLNPKEQQNFAAVLARFLAEQSPHARINSMPSDEESQVDPRP